MSVHPCQWKQCVVHTVVYFLDFEITVQPIGCHSQAWTSAPAAEWHQCSPEEPTASHAYKSPAGPTEGQTLHSPIFQPPHVLWLPKPYDAWLKQVSFLSFLHFCCFCFLARNTVFVSLNRTKSQQECSRLWFCTEHWACLHNYLL